RALRAQRSRPAGAECSLQGLRVRPSHDRLRRGLSAAQRADHQARRRDRCVLLPAGASSDRSGIRRTNEEVEDTHMRRRQIALILVLIVDVGYIAWGAGAAAMPEGLLGPGGKAILPAAYEGYSGGSWSEFVRTSPMAANYMILLYRMYGIYCLVFGLMASAI